MNTWSIFYAHKVSKNIYNGVYQPFLSGTMLDFCLVRKKRLEKEKATLS
jgi:hypothetical protein